MCNGWQVPYLPVGTYLFFVRLMLPTRTHRVIIVGAIIIVIGVLGCCGTLQESQCMLFSVCLIFVETTLLIIKSLSIFFCDRYTQFMMLLFILCVALFGVGGFAFAYTSEVCMYCNMYVGGDVRYHPHKIM